MTDESEDVFEKMFGKAPETGYRFTAVEVTLTDNDTFKGFNIDWTAAGIGFGGMWFGWGLDKEHLKNFPKQQGFHLSTECMKDEFVEALLKEAMPQIVQILIKHRTD
jgi:hypothetical protein